MILKLHGKKVSCSGRHTAIKSTILGLHGKHSCPFKVTRQTSQLFWGLMANLSVALGLLCKHMLVVLELHANRLAILGLHGNHIS